MAKQKKIPKNKKIKIKQLKSNIEIKEIKSSPKNNKKIEIREKKFAEVIQQRANSFSPVLTPMQIAPRQMNLEEVAQSAPKPKRDEKKTDEFSYRASQGQKNEAKYNSAESIQYDKIEKISDLDLRKKNTDFLGLREAKTISSDYVKDAKSQNVEKYVSAERFDIEKEKKKDIFEMWEIKYTPMKS